MKYSINWLQQQTDQEVEVDYLFFWGHTPKQAGVIDKSCFSQWYPAAFNVDHIVYPTAEHWMMAKKALIFNDTEAFSKIIKAAKPAVAKAIGREVKNFDAAIWNDRAYDIVVEGNYHKFSQDESLMTFLMRTGKKILVEASPTDAIWGIGLSQDAEEALHPAKWKGTNWLGFALMEVRDRLKEKNV
jgi:ribA/ribD-fused uncharacterized protein